MTESMRLIRWPDVHKKIGKSRTQVWRDIRAGRFPAPLQLGPNSIGWEETAIDHWLTNRPVVNWALKNEVPKNAA